MFEIDGIVEACRQAATLDVTVADDAEISALVGNFAAVRAAVDAAELAVLGALEAHGVCDRMGHKTPMWVANETRACPATIRGRVKVATTLRSYPDVAAALAEGRITFDHGQELARVSNPRVIEQLGMVQDWLINRAADRPFEIWRRELHDLVKLLDEDGGFDPVREQARNRLHRSRVAADEVLFSGMVVGAEALVFEQAIQSEADRLFHRYASDQRETGGELPIPARATLEALALVELIRRGIDPDGVTCSTDITLILQPESPDEVPPQLRPHLDHHDHDQACDGSRCGGDAVHGLYTADGSRLPIDRYRHLVCDARFYRLILDQLGVPLDLGREARRPNRAQRRALARRDGGCIYPGCDRPPSQCDAHHVRRWDDDGGTDLDNLALLCRYHHGVTHRHGWTMKPSGGQRFTWRTPTGRTLHSQRQRGRPPDTRHRSPS
jgi:hypothetical protein